MLRLSSLVISNGLVMCSLELLQLLVLSFELLACLALCRFCQVMSDLCLLDGRRTHVLAVLNVVGSLLAHVLKLRLHLLLHIVQQGEDAVGTVHLGVITANIKGQSGQQRLHFRLSGIRLQLSDLVELAELYADKLQERHFRLDALLFLVVTLLKHATHTLAATDVVGADLAIRCNHTNVSGSGDEGRQLPVDPFVSGGGHGVVSNRLFGDGCGQIRKLVV
mmetsp:Transcript_128289/g.191203  ORF Transcript_128289/g.191203 Transcript_128289/m.191203 type:complete len:221 (+) Transcript_128289:500-1162(+)